MSGRTIAAARDIVIIVFCLMFIGHIIADEIRAKRWRRGKK